MKAALGLLKKAVQLAESLLRAMADERAKEGNVTIANLYLRLDERYGFLREKADEAYALPQPPRKVTGWDKDGKANAWT